MNVTITPKKLRGRIIPPPSKSQAHRLIIAAALAKDKSVISNVALSQDIQATLNCMETLGAKASIEGNNLSIFGIDGPTLSPVLSDENEFPRLDCGESGSTLRFLIPIALALSGGAVFSGRGRLLSRPQKPYEDLFSANGLFFIHSSQSITVRGKLRAGTYQLPGDVSSQFITGLLYALPLLQGDSYIQVTTQLESLDYVAMTLDALNQFGVTISHEGWRNFYVPGGQTYHSRHLEVEADWSQAGFWYAASGIGNQVEVDGMNPHSIQGDKVILSWGELLGASSLSIQSLSSSSFSPKGSEVSIDVSHSPDLVPPVAAWGALREGVVHLKNAARLRMKESDRLSTVTHVLTSLGANVQEGPDSLTIVGKSSLPGGVTVSAHNDHRIAMMAAIAATCCENPITITGAECVAKSYPNFWADYEKLGGQIQEV